MKRWEMQEMHRLNWEEPIFRVNVQEASQQAIEAGASVEAKGTESHQ
jgi:hypothetical protein